MAIGTVGMITLESDQGKAFLVDLPDAFLVVLTTVEVNLGRLRIEIRKGSRSTQDTDVGRRPCLPASRTAGGRVSVQ